MRRRISARDAGRISLTLAVAFLLSSLCATGQDTPVAACPPNCVTAPSVNQAQPVAPSMKGESSAISPLPPDQSSPLSNPDSVLSPQQSPSQMPAPITSLAAGQGASTAMSQVPVFMGDFFGGAATTIAPFNVATDASFLRGNTVSIPSSTTVGVVKIAENTSPLPRDRVFLSYNNYSSVQLIPGGIAVNRFAPGFEKTFFNGNASVEVQLPMAITLGSTTSIDRTNSVIYDPNQYQFGNIATWFKALLYRDEQFALSTGLGMSAPTAEDTRLKDSSGNTVALISNQSWHLLPFVGSVYTPNDRFFAQTFLQLDFATNGNSVYTQSTAIGQPLERNGALNDPAYLFASLGTGYWLYQTADPYARLSRVSLISELHFNTTLQATNVVQSAQVQTGRVQSQIQTINAVVGTNIVFDQNKSLMFGYVSPLGDSDQVFAGEFRVLFNWYFGNYQNRATQVQF